MTLARLWHLTRFLLDFKTKPDRETFNSRFRRKRNSLKRSNQEMGIEGSSFDWTLFRAVDKPSTQKIVAHLEISLRCMNR
jgi:hypothetical protein